MLAPTKAYTLGIMGDPEHTDAGAMTQALAEALGSASDTKVISGDYLDKKTLSNRTRLFHIGVYHHDVVIDAVCTPVTLGNASIAFSQAHRLVWVLRPEAVSDDMKAALHASGFCGIASHLIVLNTSGVDPEVLADKELSALMELEMEELFQSAGIKPERMIRGALAKLGDGLAQSDMAELVGHLFEKWPMQRRDDGDRLFTMSVEQCYGVTGPDGKPARAAFGPIRGGPLELGQVLTAVGFGAAGETMRVSEIEQFGQKTKQVLAGGCAAAVFHGAAKGLPKAGQVLTDRPDLFIRSAQLSLEVQTPGGNSALGVLGTSSELDVCTGPAFTAAKVIDVQGGGQPAEVRLRLHSSSDLPFQSGQVALVGKCGHLQAWGRINGNV